MRWGNSDPRGGPLNVYRTTDGWVALVVGSDTHWEHLCALMHRPDLAVYGATLADRTRHLDELDQVVAAWCAGQETGALAQALGEAGIPSSPVVDPIELRHDPHVAARGTLADLVHPATPDRPSGYLGTSLPIRLSAFTRRARPGRDPRGQHGPGAVGVPGPDPVRARRPTGAPGDLTLPADAPASDTVPRGRTDGPLIGCGGTMDDERARELLLAERIRVEGLLAGTSRAGAR